MKVTTRLMAVVLGLLICSTTANAATFPQPYNQVRVEGIVTGKYSSVPNNFGAVEIRSYDNRGVRIECPDGTSTSLGCAALSLGDQILVYGHMQNRSPSGTCGYDGFESFVVVNLIYRFNPATGYWTLLTS